MPAPAKSRIGSAVQIAAFYARRPARVHELGAWVNSRRQSPMDARSPWWPFSAIPGVGDALPADAEVFEYGGGGSTLWLTDRGAAVTVVEHDRDWHTHLLAEVRDRATVLLREPTSDGSITGSCYSGVFFDSYVHAIDEYPDATFDLVIVDGRARVACGFAAMPKVKPGGMLLLDDSYRPRYAELRNRLAEGLWSRRDFHGLKPGVSSLSQTSVWRRP